MNKKERELKFKQAMINFFRFIPPNLNEEVLRMMDTSHPVFQQMTMRYIRMQKNEDWSQFIVFEESYNKQLKKMLTDDSDDEKTKELIANVNTLKKTLSELRSSLLNNDEAKPLYEHMMDIVEEEQLLIRPELIAEAIKDGKDMEKYLGGN